MPGYESIMICGRAPDELPRVLSLDNDGRIPGVGAYYNKVLDYGPIAYWPLWDAVLPTAEELVNSPAQDGTHVNVTLGQPGIGDGRTSCLYDGATSYTNIWTPSLRDAFNGDEGTLLVWTRVSGAGVWTDGAWRFIVQLRVDNNNRVFIAKSDGLNTLAFYYIAGGVAKDVNYFTNALTWLNLALTWSKNDDEVRFFAEGAQFGATLNGLGNWAGNIINTRTNIGADATTPTNVWDGYLAHVAVFDRALSLAAILDLSTA